MELLNKEKITQAINLLKKNKIIILPTDTIYGLSALVNDKNMLKINKLKNSESSKPLIVLVADFNQAKLFIDINQEIKEILLDEEPTTVIFKKEKAKKCWAIRLVKRQDLKEIILSVGPIFSTSVNKSGADFLSSKLDLVNFLGEEHCFYAGELKNSPSKIIDYINKSQKR